MWSRCIVCSAPLGANVEVESFPVGRRLVFDPSRGRLWVVCPRCARWNLTPIEQRWEAVEELERLWASATARITGEDLSLSRLRSGMEVVRVGRSDADRELAHWRWGRSGRGRRIPSGIVAGGLATGLGLGAYLVLPPPLGLLVGMGAAFQVSLSRYLADQGLLGVVLGLEQASDVARLSRPDFLNAGMNPSDDELGWSIHLQKSIVRTKEHPLWGEVRSGPPTLEWLEFKGQDALRIARKAFPLLNPKTAAQRRVTDALDLVKAGGGAPQYLRTAAAQKPRWVKFRHYPSEMRLALEMVLFQEEERIAMEGELARLRSAWEEAEELASIADSLLPPAGWARFRARHGPSSSHPGSASWPFTERQGR